MTATDLCFTSAVELAQLIRRRALSPAELTRAVLDRIERLNGRLGAYVLVHGERAMEEARRAEQSLMAGQTLGALHGVPISIKDNLWTAGDRTTSGSRLLSKFVPHDRWRSDPTAPGRALEDALVLRAAAAFEMVRPWAARRPSVAALEH